MPGKQGSFTWKQGTIFKTVKGLDERANKAVGAAIDYQATRSEAWLKVNAPWKDDTGNARNGLFTATQHEGKTHRLLLSHGVPYGIWLETRFSGRYAVILPGFIVATEELRELLTKLFSRMPGGA